VPSTGERVDPFLAFRFAVRFEGGVPVGGFSECTGLSLETQVQDHPEGGLNTHLRKFPTRTVQPNVVLKRGVVDKSVWDWYWALVQGDVRRVNVAVVVFEPDGDGTVMEFTLRDAFPCKWTGPDLNAAQSSVATEMLELCHEGLIRDK
jgi:phage tail-like protein